jgi:hypothetical protein
MNMTIESEKEKKTDEKPINLHDKATIAETWLEDRVMSIK